MTPTPAPHPNAPFHFDRTLAPDGYVWWYVDALSDDGRHGLTLIAMLGTVFSPYYAWARRRGPTDPLQHCALNVALYGGDGRRWAMTERDADAVERSSEHLRIGPSQLHWDGSALVIDIDERTAPLPRRLRGRIRVDVAAFCSGGGHALDAAQRHVWQPLAPVARVDVSMDQPRLRWSGQAYLDSNFGLRPLEQDFVGWTWARGTRGGTTTVTYDVTPREGNARSIALRFDADGHSADFDPPPPASLPRTGWGIARSTRCDARQRPSVRATLEDGPFYARSLIDTWHDGEALHEVHESLSLTRFASPWVQVLLPVRMPRRRS